MYLKSLTLKGFKSFASSTTMQLEPGITCIVGPNGSGKSNVVDALAWVMGEQGAKSLRGGKMEDVIFAGTSGRPPLGRAEVQLTIDNSDGALPIDYAEVTISRTMFRNGGSEYAINGSGCRLLDVQELLSDSGIGREMHVIVGQGQLDSILHATPEDRRGFIEEAAGVLKHRKRKEKALRKLDATDGNLTRLADLLSEIRRQLKPLGRQAEVARQAQTVQADVRDARARLLADDLVTARTALESELADESVLLERREQVEAEIAAGREQEARLEATLRDDLPRLAAAQETWFALSGLKERLRGTASLADERIRNAAGASEGDTVDSGRDPDDLEAQAERVRRQEAEIAEQVEAHRAALDAAVVAKRAAEEAAAEEDKRIAGLQRAAADRREGLARLTGQVNALTSRAEAADAEIQRLTEAREEAVARAERAQRDFTALETKVAGLDAGEEGLDSEHEEAVAVLDEVDEQLARAREDSQQADRDRAGLVARRDALELGLNRKDGAGALLAATDKVGGLLGSVAALLDVDHGYETAVAAALGTAADAVVVTDPHAAIEAIGHLKDDDLGRAGLVLGGAPAADRDWPGLPDGVAYAVDVVSAPEDVRPALVRLLHKVAVVDDLDAARRLVEELPDVVAVTREGDLLGAHFAAGGSSSQPSLIEIQAAVDEATSKLAEATAASERLGFEISRLEAARHDALKRVDVALAKLHESDATLAAVAEELGQYGSAARAAKGEADRLERAITTAREAREKDLAGLAELQARLAAAEDVTDEEPDTSERERLAEAAREARQGEMDARLALRTAEERARALHGRADSLLRAAQAERDSRARAAERRERLLREGRAAQAVAVAVRVVLHQLERSVMLAADERAAVEESRRGSEEQLMTVRTRLRDLGREHDELVSSVHRDEMARTQQKMRIEQLEERALEELGLDPDGLVADYGPETLIPFSGEVPDGEEPPEPTPFVREEQVKRLRSAERALSMLGRVNPLALEEFSAMEERHKFLTEQLEDLKRTRKDLLDIVREVDARVEQVFTEAYADVEKAFDQTFARLFPGGEGRLVLTDPGDMLNTGIEVEARPAGKKVKRLSLLSGGERSLVAVCFLVALFKARPSPFYILDEVEAALDDTNLGRLLEIYEELRENSQLLVITHQKRTMEVGDALYGVTMRGDGVSAVISQRLRDAEPA
ncbi:chromosome segregation protein SMC [Nocardioides ganghwensis]|uniref:Chromosome partition protein Smc n=1 Tax=Nocardioides ganghwensis TaxID=252230 RepID=A0A4Q2SDG9_9ACTN|nr:chromosome segregation protein SMC [Nocardioides ganghwensis]MBD3946859.1 chromosome segregation protein SMC [Nocardioides ganghwensis]RYC02771.1 chromosome segregation protein SMC [Nocardioides ganghwensis]